MAADVRPLALVLWIVTSCQSGKHDTQHDTQHDTKRGGDPAPAAEAAHASDDSAAIVLALGGTRITQAEFLRMLGPAPQQRLRITEPERRRAFLVELERTELLAIEADRRGYFREPASLAARQQALIAALLQDLFGERGSQVEKVTDADVRARYERDLERWTRAERVRARHILVKTPAAAERLLREVARSPTDPTLFTKLAHEHSLDARTRERGGDLGWFNASEPTAAGPDEITSASLTPLTIPQPVRTAAFALPAGELAPTLVKSKLGHHVLQLLGRQPSTRAEFAQVARLLGEELRKERTEAAAREFTEGLVRAANVRIDEAALSRVRLPE
jgi:peptidyl-prolyl cis-trans isomerase C